MSQLPPPRWDPTRPAVEQSDLVRFVRYRDPIIDSISEPGRPIRRILQGLLGRDVDPRTCPDPTAEVIDAEVRALMMYFRYIHDPILTYVPMHPHATPTSVVIPTPTQIINQSHEGSCVSLSCLLAAVLFAWQRRPLLVVFEHLLHGQDHGQGAITHVALGYWRGHASWERDRRTVIEATELQRLCASRDLRCLESMWITSPNSWLGKTATYMGWFPSYRLGLRRYAQAQKSLLRGRHRVRFAVDVGRAVLEHRLAPHDEGPKRPTKLTDVTDFFERSRPIEDKEVAELVRLTRNADTADKRCLPMKDLLLQIVRCLWQVVYIDPTQPRPNSAGFCLSGALGNIQEMVQFGPGLAQRILDADGAPASADLWQRYHDLIMDLVDWWQREGPARPRRRHA